MTEREEISEELRKLSDLLASTVDETDAAIRLGDSSLVSLRQRLSDRFEKLSRSSLSWTLSGPATFNGAISVNFLSEALSALQATVSSIAQAVEGAPTARARIPVQIRAMTEMRLLDTFEGSFGLHLEGPVAAEQTFPGLPGVSLEPLFERSLLTFFDLLEQGGAETTAPNDDVLDRLATVGSRAVSHLKQLAAAVAGADAPTRFDWSPPEGLGEHRSISFGPASARRLGGLLRLAQITERTEELLGRLQGASMIRDTFEFQLVDDTVLRGRVERSLIEVLPNFFGKECRATFVITAATSRSTGAVVEKLVLTAITEPEIGT